MAACLLVGCSAGGPLDAPVDTADSGARVASLGTQELVSRAGYAGPTVPGADGTGLPLSLWQADEPRAVILALHGFGDYGPLTFEGAAESWAEAGITTYAYDQRGFGRGSTHGRWPGAPALVDDLQAAAAWVRARHPCLPLVVVGHSMGGGVAMAAAGQGLDADALVLAAPAIWGGSELNPAHRLAAWLAATTVPERRFSGEGLVRIQASDNIEMLRRMARDPYYLRPPSAREMMGLVRITDMAAASAEEVRMPALLLLGERDQIVPEGAVRRVFKRVSGPRETRVYPDGWHLLFRDLEAARVWRDVANYALDQAPEPRYAGPACGATDAG
ncbi:alpha/beta fold hydrolase [Thermohalobaculum xanthum]|nr:alpha/beta fold hydrolase [Thermohalobaculum xanthum]